eukprot:4298-Heterococcus_DN1.PRE.1
MPVTSCVSSSPSLPRPVLLLATLLLRLVPLSLKAAFGSCCCCDDGSTPRSSRCSSESLSVPPTSAVTSALLSSASARRWCSSVVASCGSGASASLVLLDTHNSSTQQSRQSLKDSQRSDELNHYDTVVQTLATTVQERGTDAIDNNKRYGSRRYKTD